MLVGRLGLGGPDGRTHWRAPSRRIGTDFQKLIGLTVPLQSSMDYDAGCLATLPQLPNVYNSLTLIIKHGRLQTRSVLSARIIYHVDMPCRPDFSIISLVLFTRREHGIAAASLISGPPRFVCSVALVA